MAKKLKLEDGETNLLIDRFDRLGLPLPKSLEGLRRPSIRRRLKNFLRLLALPFRSVAESFAWKFWGRRRFELKVLADKRRMMQLAGVKEGTPPPIAPDLDSPVDSHDWAMRTAVHAESVSKAVPFEPPVVTDKVVVDYKIVAVASSPYLVTPTGDAIKEAAKPKRKRSPSKKKPAASGRSRGKRTNR